MKKIKGQNLKDVYINSLKKIKKDIKNQSIDVKVLLMAINDLAKLASDKPEFYNPIIVNEVIEFRNFVLENKLWKL